MTLTPAQKRERCNDQGQTVVLTEVQEREDYFVLSSDSTGFHLQREYGVTPKVGDTVTLYTHQGSMINGLDLNGEPIFYKTKADQEEDHRQYVEEQNRRRDEEFEAEREKRDAAFDALPEIFQQRILWFRANNPRFRQDYESYEMSACIDAVKLAEWARSQDDPAEAIRQFQEFSNADQEQTVPGLAYDQHSGNSFGFAVRLAYHFVTEPRNVYEEHGAMVPLVGCVEYGCAHPRD